MGEVPNVDPLKDVPAALPIPVAGLLGGRLWLAERPGSPLFWPGGGARYTLPLAPRRKPPLDVSRASGYLASRSIDPS